VTRLAAARLACLAACVLASAPVAAAERVELGPELWQLPRSGRMVSGLDPLRRIVEEFERDPAQRVAIRHPGGDAGTAWATEVRDWLVAMGIASEHIVLLPGTGLARDGLVLETGQP